MPWNADYRDLLAPHYEALKEIFVNGPEDGNEKQADFVDAVNNKSPIRPTGLLRGWKRYCNGPSSSLDLLQRGFPKADVLGHRQS